MRSHRIVNLENKTINRKQFATLKPAWGDQALLL